MTGKDGGAPQSEQLSHPGVPRATALSGVKAFGGVRSFSVVFRSSVAAFILFFQCLCVVRGHKFGAMLAVKMGFLFSVADCLVVAQDPGFRLDGLKLARGIKNRPNGSHDPVLFSTVGSARVGEQFVMQKPNRRGSSSGSEQKTRQRSQFLVMVPKFGVITGNLLVQRRDN